MTPRTYVQGLRAATASATRDRIIDAAATVYREQGVSGATIQAVAERADVSRGTVLNHFGGADGLLEAVLDRAVEEIGYPDEADLAGAANPDERIRRYVDVMFRFFDRGNEWWAAFYADLEHPAIKAREQHYWGVVERFHAAAFGELANDRFVGAATRALVDYWPLNSLRSSGLSVEEAIGFVGDVLVDVTHRRKPGPKRRTIGRRTKQ